MSKTLYDILEVDRTVSDEEVEAACSRLVNQAEAELSRDSVEYENRIKVLEHARDSLNSDEKRQRYNASLRNKIIRDNAPRESLFMSAMVDVLRSKKMIFISFLLLIIILTMPSEKKSDEATGNGDTTENIPSQTLQR
jgi:predicted protein tyrosine phosphatase